MKRSENKDAGTTVNIATLKSHLAKYLRMVRSGKLVTVTDHSQPVARIVPYESGGLNTIKPKKNFSEVAKLSGLSPSRGPIDTLALLLEERGKR